MPGNYNIYICDDNPASIYELKKCVEAYLDGVQCKAEFRCFDDYAQAENLLKDKQCKCDVFFLDIVLGDGKNGIELADRFVAMFPDVKIVFITGYADEYSQAIFLQSKKLRPYGFIAKPFDTEVVNRILSLILENKNGSSERFIEINKGKQKLSIKFSDILYIESYKRKLIFHLRNGKPQEVYGKISEISDSLDKSFSQCHRSYVVNLEYVYSVDADNSEVLLVNNENIIIGATKKDKFMNDFFKYKGGL
jgi:DNA-binding LytR/AlgR family response regulator